MNEEGEPASHNTGHLPLQGDGVSPPLEGNLVRPEWRSERKLPLSKPSEISNACRHTPTRKVTYLKGSALFSKLLHSDSSNFAAISAEVQVSIDSKLVAAMQDSSCNADRQVSKNRHGLSPGPT